MVFSPWLGAQPVLTWAAWWPQAQPTGHGSRFVCHGSFCTHLQEPIQSMASALLTSGSWEVSLLQWGSVPSLNGSVTLANPSPLRASGYSPVKWEIWKRDFIWCLCVKIRSLISMLKTTIYTCNLKNIGFFFLLSSHLTNKNGALFYTVLPLCSDISHSLLL